MMKYLFSKGPSQTTYSMKTRTTKTGCEIKLFYTGLTDCWMPSVQGKLAARLIDDGNGLMVSFREPDAKRLDYCQFEQLMLMIREYFKLMPDAALPQMKELVEVTRG